MRRTAVVIVMMLVGGVFGFGVPNARAGVQPHMAGGGWVSADVGRVHFSVNLPCSVPPPDADRPATLEVTFGGQTLRLVELTSSDCPSDPTAPGGTLEGSGVGTCDGNDRITLNFSFTDGGQGSSGRGDRATVQPPDPGKCRLSFSGPLGGGNIRLFQEVE